MLKCLGVQLLIALLIIFWVRRNGSLLRRYSAHFHSTVRYGLVCGENLKFNSQVYVSI